MSDTEQTSDKTAKEIGAAVALGFKQSFSYGSDFAQFKGETDISLNVSASYKYQHDQTHVAGSSLSGTRKFIEKAKTQNCIRQGNDSGASPSNRQGARLIEVWHQCLVLWRV